MHLRRVLLAGAAVRLALALAGTWQDSHSRIRYTDVDYDVFSDAARFMAAGGSPYDRATYRYTPLLAAVLLPNVWFPAWGKALFCAADLLAGWLVADVLRATGASDRAARLGCAAALFNPFTVAVSTRGSCDSLLAVLLLLTLRAALERRPSLSGALLGCATHLRLYPLVHCLPLGLFFLVGPPAASWPRRVKSASACAVGFLAAFTALGALCHRLYGARFVQEAYLYHLGRSDPRHNFAADFYGAYLSHARTAAAAAAAAAAAPGWAGLALRLAGGSPQAAVVGGCGWAYRRDPPAAFFFQTLCFVALNRVITAQYFTWWMCLAPLLAPGFAAGGRGAGTSAASAAAAAAAAAAPARRRAALAAGAWLAAQLYWLACAAALEFGGPDDQAAADGRRDAFRTVWRASLLFLAAQALLAATLMGAYTGRDLARDAGAQSGQSKRE